MRCAPVAPKDDGFFARGKFELEQSAAGWQHRRVPDLYVDAKNLAELAGISRSHLLRLTRDGKVPGAAKQSGRWMYPDSPELRAWIVRRRGTKGPGTTAEVVREPGAHRGMDQGMEQELTAGNAVGPGSWQRPVQEPTGSGSLSGTVTGFAGFSGNPITGATSGAHQPMTNVPGLGASFSGVLEVNGSQREDHAPREVQDPLEHGRRLGFIGLMLYLVPLPANLIGRLIAAIAFDDAAGGVASGGGDWVVLAANIIGMLPGVVGAVLMTVALHEHGARNRWFFWGAVVTSIGWGMLLFPIGVLVGAVVLAIFMWQLHIFFPHRR